MTTVSVIQAEPRPGNGQRLSPTGINSSTHDKAPSFDLNALVHPKPTYKGQALPPIDPKRAPLHSYLFLGGLIFFPLWYYGAFKPAESHFGEMHRWRCQALAMITTIIIAAMLVLQLGFRTL